MTCPYCKTTEPHEPQKEITSEPTGVITIYRSGHKYRVDCFDEITGGTEELVTFNYCPMCGNKLND